MRKFPLFFLIGFLACLTPGFSSGLMSLDEVMTHSNLSLVIKSYPRFVMKEPDGITVLSTGPDSDLKGLIVKGFKFVPYMVFYSRPSLAREVGQIYHRVGMFYLKVYGSEEAALCYFSQGAGYGEPDSAFMKALIHRRRAEHSESSFFMRKAARKDHTEAVYHLATFYEKGIGIGVDLGKAEKGYRFAQQNGFQPAALALGHLLFDQQKFQGALEFFNSLSQHNEEAYWYRRLLEVFLRPEEQLQQQSLAKLSGIIGHFRDLDDSGDPKAPFCLVGLLSKIQYNWKGNQSIPDYTRSAKRGYAPAQIACGYLYLKAKKNYRRAFDFFTQAADQGHPRAMFQLAVIHERSYLHPKKAAVSPAIKQADRKKAKAYYAKAAKANFLPAIHELAMILYSEGKTEEAISYLTLAAKRGFSTSVGNLGLILYSHQRYEKALPYLFEAGKKGNTEALYHAGKIFEGILPSTQSLKDLKKTHYCFTLAAEQGLGEAREALQLFLVRYLGK